MKTIKESNIIYLTLDEALKSVDTLNIMSKWSKTFGNFINEVDKKLEDRGVNVSKLDKSVAGLYDKACLSLALKYILKKGFVIFALNAIKNDFEECYTDNTLQHYEKSIENACQNKDNIELIDLRRVLLAEKNIVDIQYKEYNKAYNKAVKRFSDTFPNLEEHSL